MKRKITFLIAALMLLTMINLPGKMVGQSSHTYTMTIDSHATSGSNNVHWTANNATLTYSGLSWSAAWTAQANANPAIQAQTTYAQIGSQKNPAATVTISTAGLAGKQITAASIKCGYGSNSGPTVTITAGSYYTISSCDS